MSHSRSATEYSLGEARQLNWFSSISSLFGMGTSLKSSPLWCGKTMCHISLYMFVFIIHMRDCVATPLYRHKTPKHIWVWASARDFGTYHISEQDRRLCMASLCDSPEPSLLAYTKYGCRWRLRPKFRPLALLNMSAWMSDRSIYAHAIRSEISHVRPGYTVKPVLSSHSKIDKTKIFKTNVSLMRLKVLQNAPFGAFCNTFDLH